MRALDRPLRRREEAEHHVPEVRDRRVRDEALHVILTPRAERAVEDAAEHGDAAERCGELSGGLGEEPHAEPEVTVRAHLEHDGREDDRPRGRRFGVRVGQPRVHRPHRDLHEEGDREAGPQPHLDVTRELEALELEEVERRVAAGDAAVRVREVQDGGEHEEAAGHRVEEELERRLDAVRAAPDPDHHVHRDEHQLPEDVEHEQVERDEGADHARLEEEEREAPVLDALVDAPEGRVGGDRSAEQRQDDEPERDAVDRDVPVDAEALDPHHIVVEVERSAHVDAQERDAASSVPSMMIRVVALRRRGAWRGMKRMATAPASGRPMSHERSVVISSGAAPASADSTTAAVVGHRRETKMANRPAISAIGARTRQE